MTTPAISRNGSEAVLHSSNRELSTPLKVLVIAVSAIAAAVLGFWLVGQAGIAIGALFGGAAAFEAIRHFSHPAVSRSAPPIVQEPPYSLRDSTITWVTGTSSSSLALMLALHRLNKVPDLAADWPALIPEQHLLDRHIATLTNEMPFRPGLYGGYSLKGSFTEGTKRNPETAASAARRATGPFDLPAALRKAYSLLSGRPQIEEDLYELKVTMIRILQAGISDQEKANLRAHIQNNLLPIFSSEAALREHLLSLREHDPYRYTEENLAQFRALANQLLELFNQIERLPLTSAEQNLADHPCPLVFASSNLIGERLQEFVCYVPQNYRPNQRLAIHHPALLGRDLQYVYTTAENIERIRSAVSPFGVREVRDLETLMQQG